MQTNIVTTRVEIIERLIPGPVGPMPFQFDPLDSDWVVDVEYQAKTLVRHDHKYWYSLDRNEGVEPGADDEVWYLFLDGAAAAELLEAVAAAEAARDKAELWADADEDDEVESWQFSAKHYALKAEQARAAAAQIAADFVGTAGSAVVSVTAARDDSLSQIDDTRLAALAIVGTARAGALQDIDTARVGALSDMAVSKDLAERWAEEDEDVEVEAGKFSAKHWAAKSEGSAETAEAARDATITNANAVGEALQDALDLYGGATALEAAVEAAEADRLAAQENVAISATYAGVAGAASQSAVAITGLANLSSYAAAIVSASDVVDAFIYDTTKDSDGGAWRLKCKAHSWATEAKNTATRGARADFPSRALVVARNPSVTPRIEIYDLDDPYCPMWMIFPNITANQQGVLLIGSRAISSVWMLNGNLYVGGNAAAPLYLAWADFLLDKGFYIDLSNTFSKNGNIAERSNTVTITAIATGGLPSAFVNDVTAAVLPGTPCNPQRFGLPNPTIAVGTNGGAAVVRADGVIKNGNSTSAVTRCEFDKDNDLVFCISNVMDRANPAAFAAGNFGSTGGITAGSSRFSNAYAASGAPALPGTSAGSGGLVPGRAVGGSGSQGWLAILKENKPFPGASILASVTDKFSTGYMVGDTKLALAESSADLTDLVGQTLMTIPASTDASVATGSSSVDATNITLTGTGTGVAQRNITFATVSGRYYAFTFAAAGAAVGTGAYDNNTTQISSGVVTSGNTVTLLLKAIGTSTTIRLVKTSAGVATVALASIVMREGLIHADDMSSYGSDAALQAVYDTLGTGTLTLNAGAARLTGSSVNTRATWLAAGLVANRQYRYSIGYTVVTNSGSCTPRIGTGNTAGSGFIAEQAFNSSTTGSGTLTGTFVAGGTTQQLYYGAGGAQSASCVVDFDNIQIELVAEERSVAGNHMTVLATVRREVVATGADVAWYYMSPSYDETDKGTVTVPNLLAGDFTVTFWGKVGISAAPYLQFSQGGGVTSGGAYAFSVGGNGVVGQVSVRLRNTGGTNFNAPNMTLSAGTLFRIDAVKSGAVWSYYINGVFAGSVTPIGSMYTVDTMALRIRNNDNRIGQIRISQTAATRQQIAQAYEDERKLFFANAKALLPSANVLNLSYDEDTDQLGVGTANGTAVIQGLQVVETIKSTLGKNRVANSIGSGAQVGAPGILPSSWVAVTFSNGMAYEVKGTGNEGGKPYTEIRVHGTPSGNTFPEIIFGRNSALPAASGQTLTGQFKHKLISGSVPALTYVRIAGYASNSRVEATETAIAAFDSTMRTSSGTRMLNNGTTTNSAVSLLLSCPSGVAVDFTFRVYEPQMELGAIANSYEPSLSANDNDKVVAFAAGIRMIGTNLGVDSWQPSVVLRENLTRRQQRVGIYDEKIISAQAVTTDATATKIAKVPIAEGEARGFTAWVTAYEYGNPTGEAARYMISGIARRAMGGNVAVNATATMIYESNGTMDCVANADTIAQTLDIQAMGVAAKRLVWSSRIEWQAAEGIAV